MNGLLVDDDALYLRTLQRSLEKRGHVVATANDAASALALAHERAFEFALVDLRLEHDSGLDLVGPLRALHPDMRIVLVTGYASVATAVEAIKRGADDYLAKPASLASVLRVLRGEPAPDEESPSMVPLSRLEWEHIQQAMVDTRGNVSAAARLLGMHRRSLQRKLAKKPGRERRPLDELD
ncbi:response regulator transcription factor [Dokdonella sp. MW10]|uniref:response regulator transcription factor n=1 Tax=Dokdonella sp. MW10 TaxID=2992926 RepID=UPI003F7DDAF4